MTSMGNQKKKLLCVTPYYPSQENTIEGFFVKQQIELIKDGFDKLVVFRYHSLQFNLKNKFPKFSYFESGIKVINLFYFDNNYISRMFGNRMKAIKFQMILNYYLRCLFTVRFDVVLSQWALPSTYVFEFLSKQKKIISVIRGMDITILKKQFPEYFVKAIKRSNTVITNGSYAIKIIQEIDKNVSIENVYNPKNLKVFLENDLNMIPNNRPEYMFTCVGRFDSNKRQELLIKLVKKLLDQKIVVTLCLIGVGGEKENILELSKKMGIEKNILFRANLTHIEISEIYAKTDIYFQPSMREGVPNALVEAMASGCCCIARNVGGIPDLIEDKKTGYLFRDDSELYTLVKLLLKSDQKEIRDNARKKVISMFDNEVNIGKLLKYLN